MDVPAIVSDRAAPRPSWFLRICQQEDLNFLLTNRIPRRWATLFMGWFSRIELAPVRWLSLAVWKLFAPDLDLSDAKKQRFTSMHDCFIRQLREGARPIAAAADLLVSPCDAEVGTCGRIRGTEVIQAKGFPYPLSDLLADSRLVDKHRDGMFVTLRLRSTMYHRFHAPCDGSLDEVVYISGDTWNVNPIALRRVERLFCKNERAVLDLQLADARRSVTMVPVAAILVASLRIHCLGPTLDLRYRGPNRLPCRASFAKGDELGYFQHGSTIILFASGGFELCAGVQEGVTVRVGQPLLRMIDLSPSNQEPDRPCGPTAQPVPDSPTSDD
ncbi:MAG: phosphatidylserine decarboxylase [Planctomycetes bacterium]|nr:phosphatidylserine decarboxylase [Planctomycetota bacterium]MCB9869386.1 phosphatidylserine decarboxylase [Planctomycetota bacterium]MCB9888557.1 phosphatidylserine decarboxylase [Planctomycetota bacterium]